jgi:hypothetical protein
MREALLFSGLRRPAVSVVERQKIFGRHRSGWVDETDEPPVAIALVVETTGNGRPYEVKHAEGWWRDFSEVRIDDDRTVLRFLQMRGDPFGELEPGKPIVTSYWASLIRVLRQAATAWEPVGEYETVDDLRGLIPIEEMLGRYVRNPELAQRKVSAFRPKFSEGAAGFLRALPSAWTSALSVTYDGLEPVLTAKSLAAYLTAAAAVSLRAGLPMRRCDYCSSWFSIHHGKALWCSPSCRAAAFNERKSPHVLHQQDHDEEGNDSLAVPMERAEPRRQPKRAVKELRDAKGSKGTRGPDGRNRKPRRRRPSKA